MTPFPQATAKTGALPRKQLTEQFLRAPQTLIRQHQRLRLVHRISDQALPVQTVRR